MLAIAAVLVYAGVLRLSRNPARVYTIIAAVALVVSLIPDITYIPTVEGSSNGQTAVLMVMHVVAAAVIVPMLTMLAGPRTR
jgi:NADH:ubiquinone oxidoreductase subunit K